MLVLRFLHLLGVALWIGGAVSAFAIAMALRDRPVPYRVSVWPLLARIHGLVIAPGAVLTVLSGLMLTMSLTNRGMGQGLMTPGILLMQFAGIGGAALALFVAVPTANQLAAFADAQPETMPAQAVQLRKRQAIVSSVAGGLALFALFAGVVL